MLSEKSVGLLDRLAGAASASAWARRGGPGGARFLHAMDVARDGTAPISVVDARRLGMVAAAMGVAWPVLE